MVTRYTRDGDGFVLNGTKRFITGAGVSHAYVVFATRNPEERAKGVSAFIVMRDSSRGTFRSGAITSGGVIAPSCACTRASVGVR